MATITWKMEDGSEITADVKNGLNLMEAATANNVPHIEGECGGCLSCATCHVFVDPEWFAKTGEIDDIEDTMLEMTDVEREDNSRLSCQIIASPELDGLVLERENGKSVIVRASNIGITLRYSRVSTVPLSVRSLCATLGKVPCR